MSIEPQLFGYIAGFLTTMSFLPQAIKTIRTRDTESISILMYGMFCTGVLMWLIYGLIIDDNTIILANAITLLFASPILAMKTRNHFKHRFEQKNES